MRYALIIIIFGLSLNATGQENIYITRTGNVDFVSDAPLEIISASSEQLQGAVDLDKRTFDFVINNASFKGFNSPLQQEHFYENYIESHKYPRSTFEGKIIEDYNLTNDGTYSIRAKGILSVHGIEQERIIKCTLIKNSGSILIESDFKVPLEDHNIKIPRIVYQKIAEVIDVHVKAKLEKQ